MAQTTILIGGQDVIGDEPSIDEHVYELARPHMRGRKMRVLHIGAANGDSRKDILEVDRAYGQRFNCHVEHARFMKNPQGALDQLAQDWDIIYGSGGSPLVLTAVDWEHDLQKRLTELRAQGTVIVGNSAFAHALGKCHVHLNYLYADLLQLEPGMGLEPRFMPFAHFRSYTDAYLNALLSINTHEQFLLRIQRIIKDWPWINTDDVHCLGLWDRSALVHRSNGTGDHWYSIGREEIMFSTPSGEVHTFQRQ